MRRKEGTHREMTSPPQFDRRDLGECAAVLLGPTIGLSARRLVGLQEIDAKRTLRPHARPRNPDAADTCYRTNDSAGTGLHTGSLCRRRADTASGYSARIHANRRHHHSAGRRQPNSASFCWQERKNLALVVLSLRTSAYGIGRATRRDKDQEQQQRQGGKRTHAPMREFSWPLR